MSLPLLDRALEGDPIARFTDHTQCGAGTVSGLIPHIAPAPGEQYRFHFDMTKCIGCRCCEVACNEQNGNPPDLRWRRVGEIEGGVFPYTQRFYLSMGCNHCVDAACLKGCPVNAYRKDSLTGLVLHSADACIGCQYCTWNCPYGVPQYNSDRGVVGKCDMCHNRLADGHEPACVNACPESAIEIEIVNIAEWTANHGEADAPGLPSAGQTVSTTRITLPGDLGPELQKADHTRIRPEHPHWPLVFMLTLTQLSVGAFTGLALLKASKPLAALAALFVAFISLGASTLHLGRPIHAYRALRMWKRSWLSREVLLFSLFAGSASAFAGATLFGFVLSKALAVPTVILGLAGITASAFIYLVPARPAWNNWHTLADFHLTGLVLGSSFLRVLGIPVPAAIIAGFAAGQLLNQLLRLLRLMRSEEFEMRASARLLSQDLERIFVARLALLVIGGIGLTLAGFSTPAFLALLVGELAGRYLFFVSVVPRNMALPWLTQGKQAA
ncbi:MAG TPA: DmsC/YnfH family molybdoenzyme membrane anchor subunit [Bryobacteraceae bacterium]|nr:DmsC/YnfH family molybdoenzyme membrane anchor subunit [Bryobacteraceae bacterium]